MRLYQGPNRDVVLAGAAMLVAGGAFALNTLVGGWAAAMLCILFGTAYMVLGYLSKKEAPA